MRYSNLKSILKLADFLFSGNLGVTAHVTDIDGTWKDLTKQVNQMGLSTLLSHAFLYA
jgi:hypothetical protein